MRRKPAALSALIAFTLTLTGCAQMPTDDELITGAQADYADFVTAVGDVQSLVWEDDWRVATADRVRSCDDGSYYFSYERRLPVEGFGEWRIDGGPTAQADRIVQWLGDHDFQVEAYENTAGINFTGVMAKKQSAGIAEVFVQLFPGAATDTVTITAKSICFPGHPATVVTSFQSGEWESINKTKPLRTDNSDE